MSDSESSNSNSDSVNYSEDSIYCCEYCYPDQIQFYQCSGSSFSESDDEKDINYNNLSDEDFKSRRLIGIFIDLVDHYNKRLISPLIKIIKDICINLKTEKSSWVDEDLMYIFSDQFDHKFNKFLKLEETDKFRCCLRFIEFIEKNKNNFENYQYEYIIELNNNLCEMKTCIKKFKKWCEFHKENGSESASTISSYFGTRYDKILLCHNMNSYDD